MAEDRLTIDHATIWDNVDQRQVEFTADLGGERHAFAILYDALRALTGEEVGDNPAALLRSEEASIARAGAAAFARDTDQALTVISEADLG